jgi:hypothetical protein
MEVRRAECAVRGAECAVRGAACAVRGAMRKPAALAAQSQILDLLLRFGQRDPD